MTNSLLQCKFLMIILLSVALFSASSLSYAHTYGNGNTQFHTGKVEAKQHTKIQVRPIARTPNKLLPQTLYVQTNGHTFKRKFSFQNNVIKQVYYDAAQPVHKLYATLISKSYASKRTSSYWP
ncbi:hypothetical protein [Colwellia ponticola]|uniref:Uncharacterized protein n=1 Tax=Colwellia ponticola TaxID=2304625 RepID=A0A8H2JJL5_9GAMM|nr:hypothetical protein [Colwellia ponticola]TMM43119.1 hypothetical protein FCS21_13390 [Colwellia ponticola]